MRGKWHIGPGAASFCLIAVILCLAVLCLLTWTIAQSDLKLTLRTVEMTRDYYEAEAQAQRTLSAVDEALAAARGAANEEDFLRAVDEALPEGASREEDEIAYLQETGDGRAIDVRLEIEPQDEGTRYRVTQWMLIDTMSENEDGWEE